ncbi:phage major capsid protein [Priestia filamentosa]|uniref:phage major capsid protein n=1 Tax=Priestia filamentosa TaxID=1402861 RepID=UPI002E1AEA65|nr:phage major capsid protein [Priestia filamentosa]MED3728532.1 phage major capsid protein [Priestia filamentosa]
MESPYQVNGKPLLKLNIQFFADPTFNPDNVLLQDAPTGKIPTEQGTGIVEEVMRNSAIMQLAKYEPMSKPVKEFQYLAGGLGAYWVNEAEVIKTSKPQWLTARMESKKLGVIIPVSKEFLRYSVSGFFNEIKPHIAEAFYTKFDHATLFGTESPFVQNILGSATSAGNAVAEVEAESLYKQLNGLLGLVEDNELDPNGFATTRSLRQKLRGEMDSSGRPIFNEPTQGATQTVLGQPIAYVNGKSFDKSKVSLFTADWDYARYGILQNIEYAISQEATLTSVMGENNQPINLFERDMFALRATMQVGFMILKDEAFAALTPPVPEQA